MNTDLAGEHRPKNSAADMAAAMGIEILTEAQYRELQTLGDFDAETSSWVQTPPDIRRSARTMCCQGTARTRRSEA